MGALIWAGSLLRRVPLWVWGVLAVVVTLYATHVHYVHKAVAAAEKKCDQRMLAQKEANDEAAAILNAKYRKSEQVHEAALAAVGEKYANDISTLKARSARDQSDARSGAIRLSVATPSSHGSEAPKAGDPATVGDGEARTELSGEVAAFLLALANEADEVVLQLTACQAVITSDRQTGETP